MATYDITSGITSTGLALNGDNMYISNGGLASSTTVNSTGCMYISPGGKRNRRRRSPSMRATTASAWKARPRRRAAEPTEPTCFVESDSLSAVSSRGISHPSGGKNGSDLS